jgi:hypothetical protein
MDAVRGERGPDALRAGVRLATFRVITNFPDRTLDPGERSGRWRWTERIRPAQLVVASEAFVGGTKCQIML